MNSCPFQTYVSEKFFKFRPNMLLHLIIPDRFGIVWTVHGVLAQLGERLLRM